MTGADFLPLLVDAFGPVGAVSVLALGVWGWAERKGRNESQEKRIEENRAHARELYETIGIIREFKSLISGALK